MCNTFQQFRTYLSGEPYVFTDFNTVEDLMNIPFVRSYTQRPHFNALCLNNQSLVAVYDGYMQTVGYLDNADLDLPAITEFNHESVYHPSPAANCVV